MKTQAQTQRGSFGTPGRLGWVFLLPLLAVTLPAQTGPEMDIERAAAVISWPASTTNYIVLSSANPTNGPWYPVLDPVACGQDGCQVAVRTTDHSQYFKLAEGEWFMDDFEDGNLDGWTIAYNAAQWANYVNLEPTNGQLRVYGSWPGQDLSRYVIFLRTNLMLADFALSIDILGWDESHLGDMPNIVLFGRVDPDSCDPSNGYWYGYSGGVGMQYGDDPNYSCMWLVEQKGSSYDFLGGLQLFGKTDPARDYRLVFYGVGSELTVQLFDLTDGSLVREHKASDDTLTNGWVGFWVVEHGPSGTVNFVLDNFVAVGTTP